MTNRSSRKTLDSDRISLSDKLKLACGMAAANAAPAAIGVLIFPIFNITMGLSPAWLSTVVFVQRLWDAMADPMAGQFSDNLRTKWGRRRPLLLFAALPLALTFAIIWFFPPALSATELLTHLLVASLVFYSFHALYFVSISALGMEATGDYHERTRLNMFTQIVTFIVLIGIQWAFPLVQSFSKPLEGVRWFGIIVGAIIVIAALMPSFVSRERLYYQVKHQRRVSFYRNLTATLRNRPFLILICARTITTFGYNIVSILGLYLNYYYIFNGDVRLAAVMQGLNGTIFQVAAISSLFWFRWYAIRHGKRETLSVAAWVLAIGSVSKLVVYAPGVPWLQVFVYITNGISAAGMAMLVDSMLPDVADYDEFHSGIRREGMYSSVLAWFDRVGNSLGTLLSGFILVWIGFDVKLGGLQSHQTLIIMKYAYFAFPFVSALLAIFFIRRYPLDASRCYTIKSELERRRSAFSAVNR